MSQASSIVGLCGASPQPPLKSRRENLPLRDTDWFGSFLGGVRRGGVYLLGGAPGSRKSGLAVQLALDLTRQNIRSLFLLTEETAERLYDRSAQMMMDWTAEELCGGLAHICADAALPPMHHLSHWARAEILSPGGKWFGHNFSMVVIDSAQGRGLSSAATHDYGELIEAAQILAAAGMTVLIINQMTKSGRFAGPMSLQHSVDAAMVLKTAPAGRALFVVKNRFGGANVNDPLMLELDDVTLRLMPSKHRVNSIAVAARSYGGGADGLVELQASLTLAAHGARGKLVAPRMPRAELQQLLAAVSRLNGIDLGDGDFSIDLRLPGRWTFMRGMELALAAALIAAYLQFPLPADALFLGEVDLAGGVRPLDMELINRLTSDVAAGLDLSEPRTVFCHPLTTMAFYGIEGIRICACRQLEQMVYTLWPSLR